MRLLAIILLVFALNAAGLSQSQQFNYVLYGRSYELIKAKFHSVGSKQVELDGSGGSIHVIFLSPLTNFAGIGYEFKDDVCVAIELYLKTDNQRLVRRTISKDHEMVKVRKGVWVRNGEQFELKSKNSDGKHMLYLRCIKVKIGT